MGSAVSNQVRVTISPAIAPPALRGLLNDIGSQILLTWSCATADITSFLLYKNANNSSFVLYQTLPGSQFEFLDVITDDPVDDIDSAVYYLIAQQGSAVSGPSNQVDNEITGGGVAPIVNPEPAAPSAPPPALGAGYVQNTFAAPAFNAQTVDLAHTRTPGFQWYLYDFFGPPPPASVATINADQSVTLLGTPTSHNGQITTATRAPGGDQSTGPWVGVAFGGGAYIKATVKFDPTQINTAKGWPAFWSLALEASVLNTSHWTGQASNYRHQVEADFMEMLYSGDLSHYGGGMHDWFGIQGVTCPPGFCDAPIPFGISHRPLPAGVDLKQYHSFGFLWIPATGSSQGSAAFFFDDLQIGAATHWSQFLNDGTQAPPPNGQPYNFGVLDLQHLVLILGTGENAPMTVESVEVWQASTAGNLSF